MSVLSNDNYETIATGLFAFIVWLKLNITMNGDYFAARFNITL